MLTAAMLWAGAVAVAGLPPGLGPHGGIVASDRPSDGADGGTGEGALELVVGPERIALYPKGKAALEIGATVTLLCAGRAPLALLPAADHYEAQNPFGTQSALTFVAVLQRHGGASAFRFAFDPSEATTFHDHRPYHGGIVGMVGQRHLELAVAALPGRSELQLYVTDAYRRPIPAAGLSATASVAQGPAHPLVYADGAFVASFPPATGPLDVHAEVHFPGEAAPAAMDFYWDKQATPVTAGHGPVEVRVSGSGYSPARIETAAGTAIKLRFLRISKETCGTQVTFPALGISRDLPLNQPVDVDLVAPQGELVFTCGMRMLKGAVVGL